MQKTFLKFVMFELVERIARFQLLLNECADALHETAPGLKHALEQEARQLEDQLLAHKTQLNRLFSEGNSGKHSIEPVLGESYARLCGLSQMLKHLRQLELAPETYLFLKDALPADLLKNAGEQSILLVAEGEGNPVLPGLLPKVLVDSLSILQKNNPLAWVGLTRSYTRHLLGSASSLETLKQDLLKAGKKQAIAGYDATIDSLLMHALNLRLLGPAYYFYSLVDAVISRDEHFLQLIEPALFFGLNHQNFTHKSLVIMHEASERARPESANTPAPLAEDVLTNLFHKVEKVIPAKAAFQAKHLERAILLQERLNQGVLLSSTPMFPVGEVAETLGRKREEENFSIYEPLGMMTEYPHSPREIVNAGWLHKVERGPVWLYSVFNEERNDGFERLLEILTYQDHLLRKSIETSEVHRVLCSV
ncbi:MAG TPA: hypothetical protein V6C52_02190 [Coleofasciculaceae cyanobacterium]|jgi:hypothetical protein